MANKHRKPGDWKNIAAQRSRVERDERTGRGQAMYPNTTLVGSAAYQRRIAKQQKGNTSWA